MVNFHFIRSNENFKVSLFLVFILLQSTLSAQMLNTTLVDNSTDENNEMIHRDGNKIVDGNGNEIFLKGTIVLGWLQWEGTVWNAGITSETKIKKKITKLVGEEEFQRFKTQVFKNFITEADLILMKDLGFNTLRVPFNHTLLEDDHKPYEYKQSGWEILDELIAHCEKHGIYVVLDLHSAPGGQSGFFVADPDKNKLWKSENNRNRTIMLWKAIADRYKEKQIIAGYDLLNEPNFPNPSILVNLYKDIINEIRKVDSKHMIIIEGNKLATDFSVFDTPLSDNMAYSYHTYHLFGKDKSREHFNHVKEIADLHNVPIWNGEFGAHRLGWTRETVSLLNDPESQNSGWIFWPWKKVPSNNPNRYRHLIEIKSTPNWDKVKKYIQFLGAKPTKKQALDGLNEFIEAIKIENCIVENEMMEILK